jgi:hypothetical protein
MTSKASLLSAALNKYTSIGVDIKNTKKAFLEGMSAADLNKLYSGASTNKTSGTATTDSTQNNGMSNPGGHENPSWSNSEQKEAAPATNTQKDGMVKTNSDGQPVMDLTDPNLETVTLPDGRILYTDPKNPSMGFIQSRQEADKVANAKRILQPALKESTRVLEPTIEDIMSALSTLSTGEVLTTAPDLTEDDGEVSDVAPAGDVLIGEDEENGGDTEDEGVGEAMAEPATSTSSEIGTGGPTKNLTSMADLETEGKDGVTGVDDSYTTEDKPEEDKTDITNDDGMSKGAGDNKKDSVGSPADGFVSPVGNSTNGGMLQGAGKSKTSNSSVGQPVSPSIGEDGEEQLETGTDKESAFWMPNDDLLGLGDIATTVAKSAGSPDAQTKIGKDAMGNLVKKPTTPTQSRPLPNMRQYVKTNSAPGMPGSAPLGSFSNVDISDLDPVIGMDAASDKALNISLNFNF